MPFDFAFGFRATLAYVTDPAYQVFCAGEAYPHTYTNANGLSINAGKIGGALGGTQNGDATNDPRIAGYIYWVQAQSGVITGLKVDLASGSAPGAGTYDVDFAHGACLFGPKVAAEIRDDTTVVKDLTNGGAGYQLATDHYIDATGADVAATTTWGGATASLTFATTTVILYVTPYNFSSYGIPAHFRLTLQEAGPTTVEADGAAAGAATATALAAGLAGATTTAAGAASTSAAGAALHAVVVAAAGSATAGAVSGAIAGSVATATGTATVNADGQDSASPATPADAVAAGSATVAAAGAALTGAVAASAGSSAVASQSTTVRTALAAAGGGTTVTAEGAAVWLGTLVAVGGATVDGQSAAVAVAGGDGVAQGVGIVTGIGAALWLAQAVAGGQATVTGRGIDAAAPPPVISARHRGRAPYRTIRGRGRA